MTKRAHRAACLVTLLLCALVAVGGAHPAPKPAPEELWEVYPLDPTAGGTERPATTTRRVEQPRSGVAGVSTTKATEPSGADSDAGGRSVSKGLVLGVALAAAILLALAALPEAAAPRVGRLVGDRRIDIAVGGAVALLLAAAVYVVIGS